VIVWLTCWTKKLKLFHYEWSASRPGYALAPGKDPPVPIVPEAGWVPEPEWTQRLEEKSFRLCRRLNLDRLVVQPVVRQYSDRATPTLNLLDTFFFHFQLILLCTCINVYDKYPVNDAFDPKHRGKMVCTSYSGIRSGIVRTRSRLL
jgi:hypothetical protein